MPVPDIQTAKRNQRLANENKAREIVSDGVFRMQLNEHKGSISDCVQDALDHWSIGYLGTYANLYGSDYCAQHITDIGDELRRLGFDIKQE